MPPEHAPDAIAPDVVPEVGIDPGGALVDGGPGPAQAKAVAAPSPARYVLRRLVRSPTFMIGAAILAFWIFMALFAPLVVPYDPYAIDPANTFLPPGGDHLLGTDELGRDILSRVLAGARPVLTIAPLATALALLLGVTAGLAAGYYRGFLDDILMRTVDALMAFPGLIIAVVVLGLLGPSELNVILVIGLFYAPSIARTVRSVVLSEREREYIRAAHLRGERGRYIMGVEVLPNVKGPIVVEGTMRLGYAVFTAATLSFLGLGLSPPSPDWGLTIAEQRANIQSAPWTVVAPAIAIASLVVAVNLVADGVRWALRA